MFEFKLAALDHIEPWGTPPDLTLHWFGLTDGSYFIDLGHTHLLEYSSPPRESSKLAIPH